MTTTPLFRPATSGSAPSIRLPGRRVTDAPTRMFHWLFALCFLGAYVTAESEPWRALHVTLGYSLAGLLAFRLLYGVVGPRHAGLGMLLRKLAGAPAWLRAARQSLQQKSLAGVNWRHGQNLLMALATVALLVLVLPLTLSGYATYNDWGEVLGGDWIEEVHGFFGEFFLVVVLGHLALILGISLLRRKNQALPMLTGRIEGQGPDLVPHNRRWLAALLLLALLAFGAWQWQQSPRGLIPSQPWSAAGSEHGDSDED
jgi:cytochrome b